MNLTLKAYLQGVSDGTVDPQTVADFYLKKAQQENGEHFSFIRFHDDYVQKNIKTFKDRPLKGAPIGVKDIILTEEYITSCGSKMLENYVSPYSATCFLNLEKNGWLMIGKTNMDEFAMGSSTESSYFGKTINCYGKNRVPGWSSWWSAVAVASDCCIAALGTDTGGSIRQPAALCGIVGMKPTYWMVSRYGVQSMASSLDQVGVLTKTVEDAEILLKSIAWFDERDSQSDSRADKFVRSGNVEGWKGGKVKELKIAVPKEALGEGLDPRIKELFLKRVDQLREQGFEIKEIDVPVLAYALSIYYTLMPAEVSTNLARFDGMKFGLQEESLGHDDIVSYYEKIRSAWFGDEAKRRILLGTFVLSSANYEGYYLKAQKARDQLKADLDKVFSVYDILLLPTSPEVAWKIGEKIDDPLKMYLADIYTIPANMAWLPAMSVPMGMIEDDGEQLPAGIQIMAQRWEEEKLFALGKVIEELSS